MRGCGYNYASRPRQVVTAGSSSSETEEPQRELYKCFEPTTRIHYIVPGSSAAEVHARPIAQVLVLTERPPRIGEERTISMMMLPFSPHRFNESP